MRSLSAILLVIGLLSAKTALGADPSPLDTMTVAGVKDALDKVVRCKWEIDPSDDSEIICHADEIRGVVYVRVNRAGRIASINIQALFLAEDSTEETDVQASRPFIPRVMAALLPQWNRRDAWLTQTFSLAAQLAQPDQLWSGSGMSTSLVTAVSLLDEDDHPTSEFRISAEPYEFPFGREGFVDGAYLLISIYNPPNP